MRLDSDSGTEEMHPKRTITNAIHRFPFFILIIIGILLYIPSYFGGFIWDDEDFVYANSYVKEFRINKFFTENVSAGRGKPSNYFRPIQLFIYSTVHLFFGFNPTVYHIVNVLFHIVAALGIYYFFQVFTKKFLVAFLTALIFLIHPVQTEAVSYVSGLSDPLYVFFGFLSLLFFLKSEKGMRFYFVSIIFFIFCLFSKETGLVFLPIACLLLLIKFGWKKIMLILPYALITSLYLLYHFTVIQILDMNMVWGTTIYSSSMYVRIATFINNFRLYLSLLMYPQKLFMERDFSIQIRETVLTPWALIFGIINILLIMYVISKRKNTPIFPYLIFCFVSFYLCFIPVSGIVLINGIFYEHFLYLPLVFFFGFWFLLFEKYLNKIVLTGLVLFGLALVVRSISRQYEWADAVRFYEQTLLYAPNSVRVRNNLAMTLAERGQNEEAIKQYQFAIQLDPGVPNLYHNLGNLYRQTGYTALAEGYYQKAIQISPNFSFSYISLLSLYQETGATEKYDEMHEKYIHQFTTTIGNN